jgi:hypothetical protein
MALKTVRGAADDAGMQTTRRLRSRLTFSNIVSLIALFVALGGGAYAAGALPPNSVGRSQLQANAVTSGKLASNSVGADELQRNSVIAGSLAFESVGMHALNRHLRARLAQASASRQATSGPQGPAGPQGPSGPGAQRVRYAAHASASPTPQAVTVIAGLEMKAECEDSGSATQLNLSVTSAEAATVIENINADSGAGEPSIAEAHSANLQINLPAGTTFLGGPSAPFGEYSRVFAHLIYAAPKTTADLTVALVLDGTAGTCAIDGVGVPAAS